MQWGGCAGANARETFPRAAAINHLRVRSKYRGQGVGTALIAAAEDLAAAKGRRQIAIGVADDNPDAERLYLSLGYHKTGIVDVSEYSWVSDDGTVQRARELDQLLVKVLA